ncbi:SDR family oxidoreductase [Gordonia rubripertincta]|uniref:SDR family oxidoreductase n=1 Tax=Gordonia rubripertincta TaxID=36822 RepID=A0ABT4MWA9_GORRU|nr:SDR family oxidoreductase [Gordonia rubripertincta]MCZ4551094.1 SDR family oxidoreductase [Gordonia rubripertincta]
MARLQGKIALISGGARGMGATHARAIVAEGGKAVIADILDEEGTALAAELGDAAVFIHLDVTSAADWKTAVDLAVSTFGGLNVLVNNAGIVNFGPLGEYTQQQWDLIMNINATGTFLGITAAKDALVTSAPSSIVNISSISGLQGSPGAHGYVASKFAVRGLTKSVALELGVHNVRANSVHPGVIKTPMTADLDLGNHLGALHRAGEPEEVSNLVVYLASDESRFQTGAEFVIDGGQTAGE